MFEKITDLGEKKGKNNIFCFLCVCICYGLVCVRVIIVLL